MRLLFLSALLSCLSVPLAGAATIHVPEDQPTIQAGIDAALDGDTVQVADGMYSGDGNLEVNTWGKALTIRSTNGAARTTIVYRRFIEGVSYARCFFFTSGEDSTTRIEGFTFTDSAEYTPMEARAIMLMQSSPLFSQCVFTGFEAGTPVVCDSASPIFDHCSFLNNTGGCSECKESQDQQAAPWLGRASAVRCSNGSNAIFRSCDFVDNVADVAQGAIVCGNSSPVLTDCRFLGNQGFYAHAAVAVIGDKSNPSFERCLFQSNHSEGVNRTVFGGAIYIHDASASFDDCLFDSSSTYGADGRHYGMAICADSGSNVHITGCTFTHNVADTLTGWSAVHAGSYAMATIERSAFSSNLGRPPIGRTDSTALLQITCTDIYGNEAGDWVEDIAPLLGVDGNLSASPLFCDSLIPSAGLYDISPCLPDNNACAVTIGAVGAGCIDEWPVITSTENIIVLEDETFTYAIAFTDPDGPDTAVTLQGLPSWCSIAANTITGTPSNGTMETSFVIIVSDGYRADTQTVFIHVIPVNDPPVLDSIFDQFVDEGQALVFALSAIDPDNTPQITAENLPPGALFVDSGNGHGTVTWTPDYQQAGNYDVLVIAADDSLAADSQSVLITVHHVNLAPVISPVAPVYLFIGDSLMLAISAIDPDGDPIVLSMNDLPAAALFIDSGNGTGALSFAPDSLQIGSYSPIVVAADSILADTLPLTITVVDSIPIIAQVSFDGETDLQHVMNHTPVIQWSYLDPNQAAAQTSFEIAVGRDSNWIEADIWNPAVFESSDTFVPFAGSPLDDGTIYSLRLRVNNGRSWSAWFDLSFRMNTAPSPSSPTSPIAGAYSIAQPILWVSEAFDLQRDPLTYDFAVGTDTTFGGPEVLTVSGVTAGIDSTGWIVPAPLNENTQYFWRTRAFDGYEHSAWSDASGTSFWVNGTHEPPRMPGMLPIPEDSCAVTELLPTFTWTSSIDPDPLDTVSYRLHLSTDSEFLSGIVTAPLAETTYTQTDSLALSSQYWWKVTAEDNTGQITESAAEGFWTWTLGDIDNSHSVNVADLTYLVGHLFQGRSLPCSLKTSDVNGDCRTNVSDLTYLVSLLFRGGDPPRTGCAE